MAVALSLLIVLPGLAQSQGYDDTRGTLSSGANLDVFVLDDDATVVERGAAGSLDEGRVIGGVAGSYFNGDLYVSNAGEYEDGVRTGGAHNRVRIEAMTAIAQKELAGADEELVNRLVGDDPAVATDDFTTTEVDESHYANDNIACDAVATVKNNRSNRSITVYLNDPANSSDIGINGLPAVAGTTAAMNATFEVISAGDESRDGICASPLRSPGGDSSNAPGGTAPVEGDTNGASGSPDTLPADVAEVPGRIAARHGDTLTITVAGVSGSVMLKVDAEGPEFTEISPADGDQASSATVKFRFVATDSDSGLAHDGELDYTRGDRDARAFNTDGDNFSDGEPRSDGDGSARDISVLLDGDDESASGNSGWRLRGNRPGVSYFLDMAVTDVGAGAHTWQLEAADRAGNTTTTDSDSDKPGDQPFDLIVDVASPEFKDARTGISFDESKKREIVDRSSIAVTFSDRDNAFDAVKDVDIAKFLVEDNTVVGVIQPGSKSDCNNTDVKDDFPLDIDQQCLDKEKVPQARIYLQLAEELAPDARPQVSMFGGAVLDLAGNPGNQDEVIPADLISPAITVTLVTDVTDRPVVGRGGEITVTINSDEDLRRLPTVYFARIEDNNSTSDEVKVKLGTQLVGDRVNPVSGEENAWARTYDNSDIGNANGLYALIVVGEDENNNAGATPGWNMARTDKVPPADDDNKADLDALGAAGLLVEIDTNSNVSDDSPGFSLSPETDVDSKESESNNPFITIDFGTSKNPARQGEDNEYGGGFKGEDSHSAVAITSITLNGNDVSGQVSSVSNRKYTLGARDLSLGEYELKVTGTDDVGNEVSGTYEFSVAARKAYKLSLTPGWNLVSLPGTPLDSSIGSVMGDSMQASIVLAYQDDAWLTAVNDNGTWRGTLTDIVGGYGYWVQTTAFESISALIPETDTSSVLPTARVIKGWNLLGVVDVLQAPIKGDCTPPAGGSEANNYFDNIEWKVAYSFDTSDNTWSKSIPDEGVDDEICNGYGYWVWSTADGVLVP